MKKRVLLEKLYPSGSEKGLLKIPRREDFLLNRVGTGRKVLDCGCCTGYFSKLLMDRGNHVQAVELSPPAVKSARDKGVYVVEHDLEEPLPFEDESFDVVVAFEILEHLFDTKGFLEECRRVLTPGGEILISTPNLNSLVHRVRIALGYHIHYMGTFPEDHHGDHIRIFNRETLSRLLQMTGFEKPVILGVSEFPGLVGRGIELFSGLCDIYLAGAVRL